MVSATLWYRVARIGSYVSTRGNRARGGAEKVGASAYAVEIVSILNSFQAYLHW
jgi:hypothetical protein